MIPSQLTLSELQDFARDVYSKLDPMRGKEVDLKGRRFTGSGKPVGQFDYVRLFDLDKRLSDFEGRQLKHVNTALTIESSIRVGTAATRGSAITHANQIFIANDQDYVAWVSTGSAWQYIFGIESDTLSSLRAGLGTNDAGYLFEVTDYDHVLQWTGSAWTWAPGEVGSGYYQMYEDAPNSVGASAWQICDGSTVARLNADGTTTNVTVPDLATAGYLKGGTASAAVAAASGTVANATPTNQAATVDAHTVKEIDTIAGGTGDFIFEDAADADHASHNHTQDAHNHGPGTLELRNKQARLYYRR